MTLAIFSPSRTEAYDQCSMKGELAYRQGWMPKDADNSLIGRIVGGAFAKGTELIHKGKDFSESATVGVQLFDRTVEHYITHGVSFSQDLSKVRVQLAVSLSKYYEKNPFAQWTKVEAEVAFPDQGNCRMDVVGIDPDGYRAIADLKYKRVLRTDYLNKTVNEYRDSWQFLHYPWAYNEWAKRQEPMATPVHRIWLILVIADPFKILTFPFFVREKLQERWIASAHVKWADIAAIQNGERQPTLATAHRDAFGECVFKQACLEYNLDPDLMAFSYVKVPRMEEK